MTPKWASSLVAEICGECNFPVPELRWYGYRTVNPKFITETYGGMTVEHVAWKFAPQFTLGSSFGQCYNEIDRIDVFAGPDRLDQRYVVLHEMAHYLLKHGGVRADHNHVFWDQAYRLFLAYDLPIMDAIKRDSKTKHGKSVRAWAKRQGLLV